MAKCTLLAGFLSFAGLISTADAEPQLISVVTKTLPSPAQVTLPKLPKVATPELHRVSTIIRNPLHRSASNDRHYNISAFGFPCGAKISAKLITENSYSVRVTAPCRPHQTVSFAVNGLRFDHTLPLTGTAEFTLPVLANSAILETVFADHEYIRTDLPEAKAGGSLRVAISWKNGAEAELVADDLPVQTIGTGPHRLQVVNVNRLADRAETVRLAIRREITETSCVIPATAQIFRQSGNDAPIRYDLSFAPASCDRIGETLELKNILEDLKLAAN